MSVNRPSPATAIYYLVHALVLLLGVVLCGLGSAFWTAVGTGLIATGVAGGVVYVYVSRMDHIRDQLAVLQQYGIQTIYAERAAQIRSEYDSRLGQSSEEIHIIGFGLKDFRRDYLKRLGELSQRASVRILLLDPDSPYAAQRDSEEGQSSGIISAEVREFLSQYKSQYGTSPNFNKERLQLRLYSSLPTVNYFRIDRTIFWGPYLSGRASGNSLTVRISTGTPIARQLENHFDSVWEHFSLEPDWEYH